MRDFMISAALLWLRVLMGSAIAYHGYQKLAKGSAAKLTELAANWQFPAPAFFAWAAVFSEFAGGILVVIGLMTRPAAALILTTMTVAVFWAHSGDPWFAINAEKPGGGSKELALCYGVMAATLLLAGGGKFSLDWLVWPRVFSKKK
jgi:putative oxidoreductase